MPTDREQQHRMMLERFDRGRQLRRITIGFMQARTAHLRDYLTAQAISLHPKSAFADMLRLSDQAVECWRRKTIPDGFDAERGSEALANAYVLSGCRVSLDLSISSHVSEHVA